MLTKILEKNWEDNSIDGCDDQYWKEQRKLDDDIYNISQEIDME